MLTINEIETIVQAFAESDVKPTELQGIFFESAFSTN